MGKERSSMEMMKLICFVAIVVVARAAPGNDVFELGEEGPDCGAALRATKGVCNSFGLDSSACLYSNINYQHTCNDMGLGESAGTSKNAFDDTVLDQNELKMKNCGKGGKDWKVPVVKPDSQAKEQAKIDKEKSTLPKDPKKAAAVEAEEKKDGLTPAN